MPCLVRRLFAALWVLMAAAAPAQTPGSAPPDFLITEAAFAEGGDHFPADGPAQRVTLPDEWARARARESGTHWYRLSFDLPGHTAGSAERPMLAAYIERACSNLRVVLNGEVVHSPGHLGSRPTRNCYYPQLAALPSALLRETGNQLDIQVSGFVLEQTGARQRTGGLSAVRIGTYQALSEAYEGRRLQSITLPQITSAVLAVGAVMCLALAYWRRLPYLAYLGVTVLLWSLQTLRLWWREAPFDHATMELMAAALYAPIASAASMYLLRYGGIRQGWIEACLWLQCLVVPMALWLAGPQRLFATAMPWYTILAAEFAAVAIVFLMRAWRFSRVDFWLIGAGLLVIVALVLADVAVQYRVLGHGGTHLILIATPVLLAAVAVRMFQVFFNALRAAEDAHAALQSRVHDVTEKLARNYAALAEQRAEEVATQERKRIAADLHDDLGAKLLTIVHTSGDERIATLARDALEEMRLSVRGIAGKPVQLADAAADWRSEAMSRLSQGGIELNWQSPGEADFGERKLSARTYVQTTRILREAVSNMLKHSGASQCNVKLVVNEGHFDLRIADNGRGVATQLDGMLDRGHGMSTMKRRAKQMQGQCLVESAPGYGTVIRLTLPL